MKDSIPGEFSRKDIVGGMVLDQCFVFRNTSRGSYDRRYSFGVSKTR